MNLHECFTRYNSWYSSFFLSSSSSMNHPLCSPLTDIDININNISSECIANPTNTTISLTTCLSRYMFKSQTRFHPSHYMQNTDNFTDVINYDINDIQLSWWFGALCWSYTLGGLVMLCARPDNDHWRKVTCFPVVGFAWVLMLVQGPLSFFADYKHISQDSILHVIDRITASLNAIMESWKILAMHRYRTSIRKMTSLMHNMHNTKNRLTFTTASTTPTKHRMIGYIQLLAVLLCATSFIQSQEAQRVQDLHQFMLWHSLWHVYPILAAILWLYEFGLYNNKNKSTHNPHINQEKQDHHPVNYNCSSNHDIITNTKKVMEATCLISSSVVIMDRIKDNE